MNPTNIDTPTAEEQLSSLQAATAQILCDPKRKLTASQRKSLHRMRGLKFSSTQQPKPSGEKYIVKLAGLTFHQLIRRLKQAARIASHSRHEIAKAPNSLWAPKYQLTQDNALQCIKHIRTEIDYRTAGKSKAKE